MLIIYLAAFEIRYKYMSKCPQKEQHASVLSDEKHFLTREWLDLTARRPSQWWKTDDEGLRGAMRPRCVKCLSIWPAAYHATVPGTRSHTVILLSPWVFVATQWYAPASWVRTPLICRDESESTLTLPARARIVRPARLQVKLCRIEPSTWQESTATLPTEEVTFTARLRTGGGSVLVETSNCCYQRWINSAENVSAGRLCIMLMF